MKANLIANKILLLSLLLLSTLASQSAMAFTDMEGKPDSINNHIGKNKWTILEVWASDCIICRKHMPQMVKFDGKMSNVRLLGVSLDGQRGIDAAEDFIMEYDMKFHNIISNPVEMSAWMQQSIGESLVGTPTFILFDTEGKLVAAQAGPIPISSFEAFIKSHSKPAAKVKKKVAAQ